MTTVADFSFAKPSVSQLRSIGATGVVMYVLGSGKQPSPQQYADYAETFPDAVALVAENGVSDYEGGYPAGVTAGIAAAQAAHSVGHPYGRALYVAVDTDLTGRSLLTARSYVNGFSNAVSALYEGGVYGCGALLTECPGMLWWLSGSTGWNGYHNVDRTKLALIQGGQALAGAVDLNQATPGWAGPTAPTPPPIPPAPTPTPRKRARMYIVESAINGVGGFWVITAAGTRVPVVDPPSGTALLAMLGMTPADIVTIDQAQLEAFPPAT